MKCILWLVLLPISITLPLGAQPNSPVASQNGYIGNYYASTDTLLRFIISAKGANLYLEIVGQGQTALTEIGKDRFSLTKVRPKAVIEFARDSAGNIQRFKWIQTVPKYTFTRISDVSATSSDPLAQFEGDYRLSVNRYKILKIRAENGHLTTQATNEGKLILTHQSVNTFILSDKDLLMTYAFTSDSNGKINGINFSRTGSFYGIKTSEKSYTKESTYGFDHRNHFTRADSLRGRLTHLRTCYDVLFYKLQVAVDPASQTISGNNTIRFKAINDFTQIQVDLFANMKINHIQFHNTELTYRREFNAVFIDFPNTIKEGAVEEINIIYSGKPQKPDAESLAGGIFWLQDKKGEFWIETVTQGSGASLWWPCKDHLSDKPDSMKINITVPRGLIDISNGKLLRKIELADEKDRFDWYVSYPITTYCVAINIGKYVHHADNLITGNDTLSLNYYSMNYDTALARAIFKHTKPMLSVFQKDFGPYPFHHDAFTVMESIYPMEHQSAISIGSFFNPFNSDKYDSLDLIRTMWHESAHEWWGNNITVKDMADLWIHEAFATYAEVLAYDELSGPKAAKAYLKDQKPDNKDPLIGTYDVNDFHLGDMYPKGALMLHTLRNVINNDSIWFGLLKGIQVHFKYQTITTDDLVKYICDETKADYHYFFQQYLTKTAPPELELKFVKKEGSTFVNYRWNASAENFKMPIQVTTSKEMYTFIYPTTEWKELDLKNVKARDFKVDTEKFYIRVKRN